MSAMISIQNGGATISTIAGKYLGREAKHIMCLAKIALLILATSVFTNVSSSAMVMFWIISVYLKKNHNEFSVDKDIAYTSGVVFAILLTIVFFIDTSKGLPDKEFELSEFIEAQKVDKLIVKKATKKHRVPTTFQTASLYMNNTEAFGLRNKYLDLADMRVMEVGRATRLLNEEREENSKRIVNTLPKTKG